MLLRFFRSNFLYPAISSIRGTNDSSVCKRRNFLYISLSEKRSIHTYIRMNKDSGMEIDDPLNIVIDRQPYTPVTEGLANVDFPSTLDVFYNPVQEFNRDISIAVLRLHASDMKILSKNKLAEKKHKSEDPKDIPFLKLKEEDFKLVEDNEDILPCGKKDEEGITILEALAASGLRSIRYAKEVGGLKEIVANDISSQAVECMKTNLRKNDVQHIVKPSQNDASLVMYQNRRLQDRFAAVDLDPYGSPHTFLDGAVQSVMDGGLLLVTCTDMAVLCGNSPETCYVKYGALSLKHKACHEMALRIILQCIESNANKYKRYVVPLFSMSADFYCRVFVRIFTSQYKCKDTFSKLSFVHQCTSCESTSFQRLGNVLKNGNQIKYQLNTLSTEPSCLHCGGSHRTAGPIWTASIHDRNFVRRLKRSLSKGTPLNTVRRIEGVLSMMEDELPDVPLYVVCDKMYKIVHLSCFKMKEFASAILNAGYRVSPTHANRNGLKTDAPYSVLWEILRAREKLHPVNFTNKPPDDIAKVILGYSDRKPNCNTKSDTSVKCGPISFKLHPDAIFESTKTKLLRFQENPQENWGPKAKSVTSLFHGDLKEKSIKRQGTRRAWKKLKPEAEAQPAPTFES